MIKLFKVFLMSKILCLLNQIEFVYGNLVVNKQTNCVDPDEAYLSKMFIEYKMTYRKYEEIIYRTKTIEEKVNTSFVYKIPEKNLFENSECLVSSRKTFDVSKKSLCPWKTEVTRREDRYPFYKLENKCTCEKCSLVGDEFLDKNFKCNPVIENIPVLVRGKCGSDGFYIWEPSLEESNLYCTCSFSTQIAAN